MNSLYTIGKGIFILLITLSISSSAFSQIKLDENKVAQFAQEVYLNCNQYTTSPYLEIYKKEINRIEIIQLSDIKSQDKILQGILTLSLKNKCNPSLQYDNAQNFVPESFNPLKYFFPNNTSPVYYQIKGIDYVIKVNPL